MMKGLYFVEFLAFVADRFGEDMCDDIIDDADAAGQLETGGAYTRVAVYEQDEFTGLVGALQRRVKMEPAQIRREFAQRLFERVRAYIPEFFAAHQSLPDVLEHINQAIAGELRKLYAEAHVPQVSLRRTGQGEVEIMYQSRCGLRDFAPELLMACAAHYGHTMRLHAQDSTSGGVFTSIYRMEGAS